VKVCPVPTPKIRARAAYALEHAMNAVLHHPYLPSPRDDAARS
jgi:hypothetical protein